MRDHFPYFVASAAADTDKAVADEIYWRTVIEPGYSYAIIVSAPEWNNVRIVQK